MELLPKLLTDVVCWYFLDSNRYSTPETLEYFSKISFSNSRSDLNLGHFDFATFANKLITIGFGIGTPKNKYEGNHDEDQNAQATQKYVHIIHVESRVVGHRVGDIDIDGADAHALPVNFEHLDSVDTTVDVGGPVGSS